MRYRADFAFLKFHLAIEIDSWKYHTSRESWTADVTKNNDVVSWGWSILRFTEEALGDTRGMARMIREALVSRGW
jgi:very-short-patch-repair endonuclease